MKGGTTMRRLITVLGVSIAAGVAITAALAYSGDSRPAASAAKDARANDDSGRVAAALGLTAADRETLAKAQRLGREATNCLLANGGTYGPDGGVLDASGLATAACASELEANDAFLESADFAGMLETVQPQFEAAARCFSRASGIPQGTIIHFSDMTPALRRRIDVAHSQCFRPDGLPR